ncbi:LysE family translocator [Pelagibius litoralis]|uniref:LysE family translocator n=1 Tax=Pelagibius litoralis TaxID=374515 RepID=A0A967F0B8_9PROT|nr:LysE family translocator [Pelagibius litoralis]
MGLTEIIAFVVVAALLVMSPGPNGVLIAKTVPASGRQGGFANIAGFVTSFYLHGALSIFGLSLILVQSAELFLLVKLLGAAYLVWLGCKALWEAWKGSSPLPQQPTLASRRRGWLKAFGEGFFTNALNPKVSMFYLAAFPQFIPAGEGAVTAAFFLVFLHTLINAMWFGIMVLLFARLSSGLRSGAFRRLIKALTGTVFLAFGAKLALLRL